MLGFLVRKNTPEIVETDFSRFIRTASPKERKKVFTYVIEKATQDQIDILEKAKLIK